MTTEPLRIVQLNAGSLLEPGWQERRLEIVSWLDDLDPDVVCLQEIWQSDQQENTAGWLASHLAVPRHWAFGGLDIDHRLWPDPSLRFGSAVLSRWPIESHEVHRLPVAHDRELAVSGIGWELLHARTAGLDVFSTHLAPAPHHADHRRRQVVAIDEIIGSARADLDRSEGFGIRRPAMPAILCGDFNAEPDSDEIRFLCSLTSLEGRTTFFQDAWRVAGEGPGLTQDWRTNPTAAHLNVHRKRIDYVFVGDPFLRVGDGGRVLSARVVFDEARTGVMASDHSGLLVEIAWPDRPE